MATNLLKPIKQLPKKPGGIGGAKQVGLHVPNLPNISGNPNLDLKVFEPSIADQIAKTNLEINQATWQLNSIGKTDRDILNETDNRNWLYKFLGFKQDTNLAINILDLLNRPANTVRGLIIGYDATGRYNPLQAMWDGLRNQKDYNSFELLKAVGVDTTNWSPYLRIPFSIGIDIATDPLTYWNAPLHLLGSGIKKGAKYLTGLLGKTLKTSFGHTQVYQNLMNVMSNLSLGFKRAFGLYKYQAAKFLGSTNAQQNAMAEYVRALMKENLVRAGDEMNALAQSLEQIFHSSIKSPAMLNDFYDLVKLVRPQYSSANELLVGKTVSRNGQVIKEIEGLGHAKDDWIKLANELFTRATETGFKPVNLKTLLENERYKAIKELRDLDIKTPEELFQKLKEHNYKPFSKIEDKATSYYLAGQDGRQFFETIHGMLNEIIENKLNHNLGMYQSLTLNPNDILGSPELSALIEYLMVYTNMSYEDIVKHIKIAFIDKGIPSNERTITNFVKSLRIGDEKSRSTPLFVKAVRNSEGTNIIHDLQIEWPANQPLIIEPTKPPKVPDVPEDIIQKVYSRLSPEQKAKYYPVANDLKIKTKNYYHYKAKTKKSFINMISDNHNGKLVFKDIELTEGYGLRPLKDSFDFHPNTKGFKATINDTDNIVPMLLYQTVDNKVVPKKIIFTIFADDVKQFRKLSRAVKNSTVESFDEYVNTLRHMYSQYGKNIPPEQWDKILTDFQNNFSKFKDNFSAYDMVANYSSQNGFLETAFKNDILKKELDIEAMALGYSEGLKMPIPDEIKDQVLKSYDNALKDVEAQTPKLKIAQEFDATKYNPEGGVLIFSDELTNAINRAANHMNDLTKLRAAGADSVLSKLNIEASKLVNKETGLVGIPDMILTSNDINDIKRINKIYAYMQTYPEKITNLNNASIMNITIDEQIEKIASEHKLVKYEFNPTRKEYIVTYEPETLQQVYEFAGLLVGERNPLVEGKIDVYSFVRKNAKAMGITQPRKVPFISLTMNSKALKQTVLNQKRVNNTIINNFTKVFNRWGFNETTGQKVFLNPLQLPQNNIFNDILPYFYNLTNIYESNRAAFFRFIDDSFGASTDIAKLWKENYAGYVAGIMNPDIMVSNNLRNMLSNKANENSINGMLNLYNGANLEKKLTMKSWHAPLSSTNSFLGQELFNSDAFIAQALQFDYAAEAFKRIKLLETTRDKGLVNWVHKEDIKKALNLERDPTASEIVNYVREYPGWSSEFKIMTAEELRAIEQTVSLNDALSISDEQNMLSAWFTELQNKIAEGNTLVVHDASLQFLKASVKHTKVFSKDPNRFWGFLDKYVISTFKRIATFSGGFHARNIVTNYMNGYLAGFGPWDMGRFQKIATQKITDFHKVSKKMLSELADNPVFRNVTNLQEYSAALRKILTPQEQELFLEFLDLYKKGVLGSTKLSDDTLHYYSTVIKAFKKQPVGEKLLPEKIGKIKELFNLSYEFGIKQDEAAKVAAYLYGQTEKGQKAMAKLRIRTPEDYAKFMFFDYNNLTPFENEIMKKIFPFYTWARKNFEFHLRNFAVNSKKYTRLLQAYNGWYDSFVTDPDTEIEYLKYSKIPVLELNGKVTYMSFPLTFLNIPQILTGSDVINALNPLFKFPFERILGINLSGIPKSKSASEWQYLPFGLDSFFSIPTWTWEMMTSKEAPTTDMPNVGLLGQRWMNVVKSMKNWLTIGDPDFNPALFLPSFFSEYDTNKILLNNRLKRLSDLNNYINTLRADGAYVPSFKDILPNSLGNVKPRYKVISSNFTLEQLNKLIHPMWQKNTKR